MSDLILTESVTDSTTVIETVEVSTTSVKIVESITADTVIDSVIETESVEVTITEVVDTESVTVEIIEIALQGPRGVQGEQGPPGPSGLAGTDHNELDNRDGTDCHPASAISGLTYIHDQLIPAATWIITHNLNRQASVTVRDSSGSVVNGDIQHDSSNQLTLSFSAAFAGVAYLV